MHSAGDVSDNVGEADPDRHAARHRAARGRPAADPVLQAALRSVDPGMERAIARASRPGAYLRIARRESGRRRSLWSWWSAPTTGDVALVSAALVLDPSLRPRPAQARSSAICCATGLTARRRSVSRRSPELDAAAPPAMATVPARPTREGAGARTVAVRSTGSQAASVRCHCGPTSGGQRVQGDHADRVADAERAGRRPGRPAVCRRADPARRRRRRTSTRRRWDAGDGQGASQRAGVKWRQRNGRQPHSACTLAQATCRELPLTSTARVLGHVPSCARRLLGGPATDPTPRAAGQNTTVPALRA